MTSHQTGQSSSFTVQAGGSSSSSTVVPPSSSSSSGSAADSNNNNLKATSENHKNDDAKSTTSTNSSLHQQQQQHSELNISGNNLNVLVTPVALDGKSEPLSPTAHRRATSISSNGYPANTPATPVHPQFTSHPEDDNDSDNGKLKGKKNKKKKWHVNAMGEIVYKEHNSYNLMRQIQMGIRSAISEITPKKQKDVLLLKDFTNINKMPFPEKGSTRTPPHEFPFFDFYDYSPFPFRHLRERFGIDASNYLVCLCHELSLSILGTPGKSGALFFFSADMQYMLKTVTKKESKFLRKILPDYYNHVMANPNTLITRFYGMYSIKPRGGKNVRFIVMNNVFDTTMYVSERYDLKGSTVGREASEKEKKRETPIYKDLDFLRRSSKLKVGPQMKNLIMNQLQVDATWLEKMKIMDYSLLVGVHRLDPELDAEVLKEAQNCNIKLSDSDIPSEAFTTVFNHGSSVASSSMTSTSYLNGTDQGTGASSSLNTTNPISDHHDQVVNSTDIAIEVSDESHPTLNGSSSTKTIENTPSTHHPTSMSTTTQDSRKSSESTSSFFGRFMNHRLSVSLKKHYRGPRASLFQQFHGGTLSLPLEDGSREIYYFGIIDLLQKWNNKKQIENIFKGLVADRNQISAVSPKNYAMRFVKFLGDGLQ
ncbi:phosphatidylinositol-4-phosphate 5-Kinase [Naegleria gruberi]|uniref:Phosphatidylinositol-4-phosphate 5-Kinase n=1 Tax=Naegleria gruberi TaxID=5762 RepID=D2VZS5_NAEGR|nr:phosphatidylinositol-4-phosphate 5-Kinase [Naegleria gruberi]EFC37710.1 phosphatidylinositol-4-phosphate 5-Kinase [Naegleria gruberi]|eukprot:XP_002670454.1 phosphatidylinositol-4-phosphate 5-Kinase [Naegleria gruberi strain NEG-M]